MVDEKRSNYTNMTKRSRYPPKRDALLAKEKVAGSTPVSRSSFREPAPGLNMTSITFVSVT